MSDGLQKFDAHPFGSMTSATPVCWTFFRAHRALLCLLLAVSVSAAAGGDAVLAETPSAAPSAAPAPAATPAQPFSVSGWGYRGRHNDVTFFLCEAPRCGPGSKVSYKLYAPDTTLTLEQFRTSQEQIVKLLDERVPGQKTTILGVDGDKGTAATRMFKVRRLKLAPDGTKEYQVSGMLFGPRGSASLISTTVNEKNSIGNFAEFAIPVMVLLALPAR